MKILTLGACLLTFHALACDDQSGGSDGDASAVDADDATSGTHGDAPIAPDEGAPLVIEPEATAMALSFTLVSDSSGLEPNAGTSVTLTLEPPSTAHVLLLDSETQDALAYTGTWSLSADGALALAFDDPDFTRAGSIDLDPLAPTVELPFQLFDPAEGTSTWTRSVVDVSVNVVDLFDALANSTNLSLSDISARVLAYAERYVAVHADVAEQALRAGLVAPSATTTSARWFWVSLIGVTLSSDGTQLDFAYSDGSHEIVMLYSKVARTNMHLTTSPLAGDPRIDLAIAAPGDGTSDPPRYSALFVAPFDATRNYARYSGVDLGDPSQELGTTYGWHDDFKLDDAKSRLEARGYSVDILSDGLATVEAIIQKLADPSTTPGFVLFATHGAEQGYIATGELLALDGNSVSAALEKVFARLRANGYADLLDYGDAGNVPLTLGRMCVARNVGTVEKSACYVSLTPYFFEWLREKRHVSFARSLVMFASCLTDHTDLLRNAVRARAYFAYNVSVYVPFAGAVFQHLVRGLTRHTHSAEEGYYNILRVANTRQAIYPEDQLFENLPVLGVPPDNDPLQAFKAYGWDGTKLVAHQASGWFGDPKPGTIWTLLFAGRWGGDPKKGSENLLGCWSAAWKGGQLGDPGTWCNQATAGDAPSGAEVAYANYLLSGNATPGSGLPAVPSPAPRWTLADFRE